MAIRSTISNTPWLGRRFRILGTDAQNVELEAYAEEMEAETLSEALLGNSLIPGFADLLEAATVMIEICDLMRRNRRLSDAQSEYLQSLEQQMNDICGQIESEMNRPLDTKAAGTKR